MMHMKKRLLALAICITLLLAACGKKPATPADSKAEKEGTVSDVKKNDNVSKDETEAFGDGSRGTEVEMNVQCIDSSSYSYNGEVIGGSLIATVYWPSCELHR